MFENIQWFDFEEVYNELSSIDKNKSPNDQLDLLKENLFRAKSGDYILDISYHPEFEENGYFTILLIKNGDWEDPYAQKRTNNIKQLEKAVQDFIYMV